ncbi:MAG: elongation factor 1-beta [Aigarchaeota archaeon]|nr:elongation factor 1-beta [Aigarchaeota archaeon]MDW8092592.1 elongation factor 1-beta [Nitrososphaerota archaeon]
MARVLLVVRVMPTDSDVNIDGLIQSITRSLPPYVKLIDVTTEPVAFGLDSILLNVSVPEEEGVTDKVEGYLLSIDGVGEISVEGMTRISNRSDPRS